MPTFDADFFCNCIRILCQRYYPSYCTSEQTAYGGLFLLTGKRFRDSAWVVLDTKFVKGDANINSPPSNVAILVCFGVAHFALIVEDVFIQSHDGIIPFSIPHIPTISLCVLTGDVNLSLQETQLFYIQINDFFLKKFHTDPSGIVKGIRDLTFDVKNSDAY